MNKELSLVGLLLLLMAIPVVWAIVDVARRPFWQFSTARKTLWGVVLGVGFLLFPPIACIVGIVYLTVLRRRFPNASSPPQGSPFSQYGQYGHGQYGPGQYGPGPYGGGPYGGGPYGAPGAQGPGSYGAGAPGGYGYQPQTPSPLEHLPPAGWYPDPAGSRQERWWDGRGWTDHLR